MKYRDLTLVPWDEETYLVVSCDSSGGIGNKAEDRIEVSPRKLGFYTTQVALMEMLSIGVRPLALSNTLSVEMNPAGEEIIKGIHDALHLLEDTVQVEVTGSTEENIKVSQTGMGITLMGRVNSKEFRFPKTSEHDLAVVAGKPMVGEMLLKADQSEIFGLETLQRILGKEYIHELIPAGSKGIIHEIRELEKREDLVFRASGIEPVDLCTSSGPATSALITIEKNNLDALRKDAGIPVYVVGEFIKKERG